MKKKGMKFTRWKLEDHLTTDSDMLGFITAAMKDKDDPEALESAINAVAKIKKEIAKKSKNKSGIDTPTFLHFLNTLKSNYKHN